jgi:hypothetical protein
VKNEVAIVGILLAQGTTSAGNEAQDQSARYMHQQYCVATMRRAIRIGNASGAIGDGIDQIYRLAKSGNIDAITADYLAEFNIAWRAIDLQSDPDSGFEPNFLEQLAWADGDAARLVAQKKIKVVHDGGALNPKGLALKTDEYFKSLGIAHMKICWVEGDDLTKAAKSGSLGQLKHLDREGLTLNRDDEILAANAYTGMAGIRQALEDGADVVICGRCTDASPVIGLASWWHGWLGNEWDKLAGSLMAGHLIECGAYVTGGNFCGAREIEDLFGVGYPIAEISSDGGAVITKPEGSAGATTVDTCKAQLLYEIQGHIYLNPDVVADLENVELTQVGRDRVRLSGIRGLPPPPTTKLAVCLLGGYQAELSGYAAGPDIDHKFDLFKSQVMSQLDPADFSVISIEKYGSAKANPRSQRESTVQFRSFVQAPKKDGMVKFKRALFYNGMQGYCGLHLSMDWRTMEPRPYVRYFPALIEQTQIPLTVHTVGTSSSAHVSARPRETCQPTPLQRIYEPTKSFAPQNMGDSISAQLGDLVFARSGDKGGNANVGFWTHSAQAWEWLQSFMTSACLRDLLADDWEDSYTIERCEFVGLYAVHFVVKGILQEGVSSSSVLDGFAKSFSEFLRARHVEMPRKLVEEEKARRSAAEARASRAKL